MQDSFVRAYRGLGDVPAAGAVRRLALPHRGEPLPDGAPAASAGPPVRRRAAGRCSLERRPGPTPFEWRDEIGRALDRLRPHYREAFLLRYVEGLDYAEMSEMTGAKEPALRMRVKRASDQLRELLRDVHAG